MQQLINTRKFEGWRDKVYYCTAGYPTIGYGHNLAGGSDANLIKVGLDKRVLLAGTRITHAQGEALFVLDMKDVQKWIYKLVPNFDEHPQIIREVLLDLGFNLGQTRLSKFKRTLSAFIRKDYASAATGLESSLWYKQVKTRGVAIVKAVRSAI